MSLSRRFDSFRHLGRMAGRGVSLGPSRRHVLRDALRVLGCIAVTSAAAGAAPAKSPKGAKTAGRQRPVRPDRAWMNAKGICVFPLAKDGIPRTGAQLAASMLAGWKGIFAFPDAGEVIDIGGGRYPAIDTMTVDLTGAVANPKHKSGPIPDPLPSNKSVAVRHFTMLAEPLLTNRAKINLKVTGTGVRFDLQHDKEGKPMLMLADAREGTLHFDLARKDLERLMLAKAQEAGSANAVAVRSIEFHLDGLGPRALKADLHVSTLVGFIPAGLRFTARVDIDEQMNARISGLTCDGDEILGPLIVGFIRPGLSRFNGQTRPLVAFPSGNLRLRDIEIGTGERISLTARFGA